MLKVWGLCCESCKWVEICCRLRFLSSLCVSAWVRSSWLLKCEYTGPCGSSAVGRQLSSIPCGVREQRGSMLVSLCRWLRQELGVLGCLSRNCSAPAAAVEGLLKSSFLICSACIAWRGAFRWKPRSAMWDVFCTGSVFSLPAASVFQHHSYSWSTAAPDTTTCWSRFRKVSFLLFIANK